MKKSIVIICSLALMFITVTTTTNTQIVLPNTHELMIGA